MLSTYQIQISEKIHAEFADIAIPTELQMYTIKRDGVNNSAKGNTRLMLNKLLVINSWGGGGNAFPSSNKHMPLRCLNKIELYIRIRKIYNNELYS